MCHGIDIFPTFKARVLPHYDLIFVIIFSTARTAHAFGLCFCWSGAFNRNTIRTSMNLWMIKATNTNLKEHFQFVNILRSLANCWNRSFDAQAPRYFLLSVFPLKTKNEMKNRFHQLFIISAGNFFFERKTDCSRFIQHSGNSCECKADRKISPCMRHSSKAVQSERVAETAHHKVAAYFGSGAFYDPHHITHIDFLCRPQTIPQTEHNSFDKCYFFSVACHSALCWEFSLWLIRWLYFPLAFLGCIVRAFSLYELSLLCTPSHFHLYCLLHICAPTHQIENKTLNIRLCVLLSVVLVFHVICCALESPEKLCVGRRTEIRNVYALRSTQRQLNSISVSIILYYVLIPPLLPPIERFNTCIWIF